MEVPGGTESMIVLPAFNLLNVNGVQLSPEDLPDGIGSVEFGEDATRIKASYGSYVIEFDDIPSAVGKVSANTGKFKVIPRATGYDPY